MSEYTITDFLKGLVRGVEIPDEALLGICKRAGVDSDSSVDNLTERDIDLSTAFLYLWIAGGPTTGSRWSEKDGEWSQSAGHGTFNYAQLRLYYRMANDLLKKYGLETEGAPQWGFRYGGIRNIRYGRRFRHH